jgi:hypothetical protein
MQWKRGEVKPAPYSASMQFYLFTSFHSFTDRGLVKNLPTSRPSHFSHARCDDTMGLMALGATSTI